MGEATPSTPHASFVPSTERGTADVGTRDNPRAGGRDIRGTPAGQLEGRDIRQHRDPGRAHPSRPHIYAANKVAGRGDILSELISTAKKSERIYRLHFVERVAPQFSP